MTEAAEFKSGRVGNALMGLGGLIIPIAVIYMALYTTEDEFLHAKVRRGGGIMKMIEQTIGWELFVFLMLMLGAWVTVYSFVSLWKVVNPVADVTALPSL